MIDQENLELTMAMIISHSCDLATIEDKEPKVEILLGKIAGESEANAFYNGHSIRNLSLKSEIFNGSQTVCVYSILDRKEINKRDLFQFAPSSEIVYSTSQRQLLQRWIQQRYGRSEFPDAFIDALNENDVSGKLDKLAKKYSKYLKAIFFDLEDQSERCNADGPYELGVYFVFDSTDPDASKLSEIASQKLKEEFECFCTSGEWKLIELLYCDSISDEEFTYLAANTFRRFRLEHRSINGEPVDGQE